MLFYIVVHLFHYPLRALGMNNLIVTFKKIQCATLHKGGHGFQAGHIMIGLVMLYTEREEKRNGIVIHNGVLKDCVQIY